MSDKDLIRSLIRESIVQLKDEREVEYGSQDHVNEFDRVIGDLYFLKNTLKRGPDRKFYRKESHRIQDAIGALKYLRGKARRSGVKAGLIITEGGLKAPELTSDTPLTPEIVNLAIQSYISALDLWNKSLESSSLEQVTPVGPVGSSAYHSVDSTDTKYGDVDYLVSFPVDAPEGASQDEIRKEENRVKRKYEQSFRMFLSQSTEVDRYVNAEATNRGSPFLVIVKLPDGQHVQVDTIVTFPRYSASPEQESDDQWMPARWTPERGLKGYTIGNLYTSLGSYFNMSIGDRGVTANVRDGQRVSSRARKGVSLVTISTNIKTFLRDIGNEIAGDKYVENEALTKNPGMNPDNISIKDLSMGIRGLALTMRDSGVIQDEKEMLSSILDLYKSGLQRNIDSKLSRGLSRKDYEKLVDLNTTVSSLVSSIFNLGA
jgi:hypothetical protein|tara:strand:+ start:6101 stop:7393 length:1293 start_codon:yes stop_codon:yes gene_type:complete